MFNIHGPPTYQLRQACMGMHSSPRSTYIGSIHSDVCRGVLTCFTCVHVPSSPAAFFTAVPSTACHAVGVSSTQSVQTWLGK
jgi:hypothetical protein